MYHRQNTIAMENARSLPKRNQEWREKQKKKISKGIKDDETEEYQIDKNFDAMWDIVEKNDFGMKVNIGEKGKPKWIQL